MSHRTISLEDLRTIPEAMEIFLSDDQERFNQMLFEIGFDIERGVEMEVVLHRPMVHSREVMGPRWIGEERSDAEWMASPHCTLENKLVQIGIKDVAFQRELVAMSTAPNYTAMFVDHIKTEVKSRKKKKEVNE